MPPARGHSRIPASCKSRAALYPPLPTPGTPDHQLGVPIPARCSVYAGRTNPWRGRWLCRASFWQQLASKPSWGAQRLTSQVFVNLARSSLQGAEMLGAGARVHSPGDTTMRVELSPPVKSVVGLCHVVGCLGQCRFCIAGCRTGLGRVAAGMPILYAWRRLDYDLRTQVADLENEMTHAPTTDGWRRTFADQSQSQLPRRSYWRRPLWRNLSWASTTWQRYWPPQAPSTNP
jgi:hypothetical protein